MAGSHSTDLPEIVAILVVDTRGFSQHNDVQQDELAPLIPELLQRACTRADLEDLWDQRQFPDSTGDGYLFGFNTRFLPKVIDRFFDALQDALAAAQPGLRSRNIRLRMRLGLNMGPATELRDSRVGSPVGNAMIATHRVVDADPLRSLLDHSDQDVTLLATAISRPVMEAAVETGWTTRHVPSEFVSVDVAIPRKNFQETAYLYVPRMSGELLKHGLIGVQGREKPTDEPPATQTVAEQPAAARVKHGIGSVSGTGNTVANSGSSIDQSRHDNHVEGDQYNARRDISVRRGRER